MLWSALPFISQGAGIVRSLFRNTPAHAVEPILTGLIFSFAGIIAVVGSLQVIYERVFDQEHRGWRDLPWFFVWVGVLLGFLIAEVVIGKPVRTAAGPVVHALLSFVVVAIFFGWTMRFLLAGRVPWHFVIRQAVVTAVLWLGLSLFSSVYFSSVVISDSRQYGTIGVMFTFLTWFILIGGVIVLGTAGGAVWQERRGRGGLRADSDKSPEPRR